MFGTGRRELDSVYCTCRIRARTIEMSYRTIPSLLQVEMGISWSWWFVGGHVIGLRWLRRRLLDVAFRHGHQAQSERLIGIGVQPRITPQASLHRIHVLLKDIKFHTKEHSGRAGES